MGIERGLKAGSKSWILWIRSAFGRKNILDSHHFLKGEPGWRGKKISRFSRDVIYECSLTIGASQSTQIFWSSRILAELKLSSLKKFLFKSSGTPESSQTRRNPHESKKGCPSLSYLFASFCSYMKKNMSEVKERKNNISEWM